MYARERRTRMLPLSSHVWLPHDQHCTCLNLSYFLARKAKAKCQVMTIIVHYNGSTLFWVSLLQILLWRLLGSHYFYLAHDTPHDLPAKFPHNHCFQFRYVIAVFSEKAKSFCLFFGGGRERGEGVGREVGWFSKVRQSGKYHLSNRGVRFIGVCYTGVLL